MATNRGWQPTGVFGADPDDDGAPAALTWPNSQAAEAYDVLSDAGRRRQYDCFGHEGLGGGPAFQDIADIFNEFGDIFGDMFGFGAARARRSARGAGVRYDLGLTFAEAAFGATKPICVERHHPRQRCGFTRCLRPCGWLHTVSETVWVETVGVETVGGLNERFDIVAASSGLAQ